MMALTLAVEQRLDDVGLVEFYEEDSAAWLDMVRDTKVFLTAQYPDGARIRPDDVANGLVGPLEVHEGFKDFRSEKKLRPKYWIRYFADLLVDRTWGQIE
ncbi:MAG: hypothetical protein U1E59_03655 [Amaricoccus sp.]